MAENDFQKFRKIIIPLDGSKIAERSLKYAISLADTFKAEIVLASVVPKGTKSAGPFKKRLEEISPELIDKLKEMPPSILMETYHEITKNTIMKHDITVKSVMKEGDTSKKSVLSMLLDLIREEKADLVVVSSYGKKGFQKLKEGSMTEELIKISPIPVLVVKK